MFYVLGIDPAKTSGWALLQVTEGWEVSFLNGGLVKIGKTSMCEEVVQLLNSATMTPTIHVAMDQVFHGYKRAVASMGETRGRWLQALDWAEKEVGIVKIASTHMFTTSQWRLAAGMPKASTGKEQSMQHARMLFGNHKQFEKHDTAEAALIAVAAVTKLSAANKGQALFK